MTSEYATIEERFIADVMKNRHNRAIMKVWDLLELKDGWLVAGCLFQTVWNLQAGRPPEHGIKDHDIFYFDPEDLSAAGEERVQRRVDAALGPLGVPVEVKNQARVHLWYEKYYGFPYPKLVSAKDGIDRFLIPSTCVGLRSTETGFDVYSPNGLDLVYAGELWPNPLTPHLSLFREKAASYSRRWDWLKMREAV
jgi:hypothetical protein